VDITPISDRSRDESIDLNQLPVVSTDSVDNFVYKLNEFIRNP